MTQCKKCDAKCCRYIALEIDTPRTKEDFESIRWFVSHEKIAVFVEDHKWFVDIHNKCSHLTQDYKCNIYDKRPLICREHQTHDCEVHSADFGHSHTFNNLEELDRYLRKRFGRKRPRAKKT